MSTFVSTWPNMPVCCRGFVAACPTATLAECTCRRRWWRKSTTDMWERDWPGRVEKGGALGPAGLGTEGFDTEAPPELVRTEPLPDDEDIK